MKINSFSDSPAFRGNIYNSKMLKSALEFASDNSALFCATTSLVLSSVARPIAILSTPNTDKENKKYATAKSISSSIAGYLLMFAASVPVSKAIKNIDLNPKKFLKPETIKSLQNNEKTLQSSKKYQFATQLFKLGLGLLIAVPKSSITSFLIPKIMKKFPKKEEEKNISFTGRFYDKGIEKLSCGISSIINTKNIQNLSDKLYKTNFEQGMMYLTDVVLTGAFVNKTLKNKEIDKKRKKPLIYNSILSTIFSMVSSLILNKATDKPFQKFVSRFVEENKDSKKLSKYLEGLNIAKLSLIMGGVYYILIPILSTFLADKIDDYKNGQNIVNKNA